MFNTLPTILRGIASFRNDKSALRLSAVSIVAGGYGGVINNQSSIINNQKLALA